MNLPPKILAHVATFLCANDYVAMAGASRAFRRVNEVYHQHMDDCQIAVTKQAIYDGRNVFLTGRAGTGKSWRLRELVHILEDDLGYLPHEIFLTGSTGKSAININGTTVHSCWPYACFNTIRDIERLKGHPNSRDRDKKNWIACRALVIDEVSMVSDKLMDRLNRGAQMLLENTLPFGGVQVIVIGDMLQLKPVEGKYVFQSKVWERMNFNVLNLNYSHRQEDRKLDAVLKRMRFGENTSRDFEWMRSRIRSGKNVPNDVPHLYTANWATKKHNDRQLEAIEDPGVTYNAVDHYVTKNVIIIEGRREEIELPYEPTERIIEKTKKLMPNIERSMPSQITLKPTGIYILTRNMNVSAGLGNGTKLVSRRSSQIDGRSTLFSYEHRDKERNIRIMTTTKCFRIDSIGKNHIYLKRTQYPLIYGHAITIHKSQGETLQKYHADISSVRADSPGQVYVALSRGKRGRDITISKFNAKRVKADPVAVSFYQKLGIGPDPE